MLATALAIKLFDKGPVFYKQRRVGRHGTVFQMIKFRSMVPTVERLEIDLRDRHASMAMLFKVNDAARITPIGHFIRRTAIDELPQLWNVIRGEMSLVGPRPTPGVNPEDFDGIDAKRLMVPPGMTGYWQVSGDNALSYEEMVKLDLAYIENWSLWLDTLLILRTIPALLNRLGPS
jgi:lipopolysaccharide/colanic/teichoic acid biosynthesis glycosyltransferase